jgi:hypothetical protein
VEALFRQMESLLAGDTAEGRRNYATADFDPVDGHPTHYVHRVRGTSRRLEWNVQLTRVSQKDEG